MSLCLQLSVALDKQELLFPDSKGLSAAQKGWGGDVSVEGKAEAWTCIAQSEGGSVDLAFYFRFNITQISRGT